MLNTPGILLLIVTLLLTVACSKEPEPADAPGRALVEQSAADSVQRSGDELRSSFAPGGIAATYTAKFSAGKIQSLEETRQATSQTATYEFLGARLMKYSGAALHSNDIVELEFDPQGKVLRAKAGDQEASAEEIAAIRDRAQSLRSHAVSQYGVKGHDQA